MRKTVISHVAFGCASALLASSVTYLAQGQPAPSTGLRQTELFKTKMDDVLGRLVNVRRTERHPGTGSAPHPRPGSHTIGYVLEGPYEVKVGDGPLQKLGPAHGHY